MLWPGSVLAKKQPSWVMVAELVETSRLWGRTAARIDPRWIEPLAEHLVKRTYSEPRWERRSEEHTSELQSRQYLVCRLLLEKKKKQKTTDSSAGHLCFFF